MPSNLLISRIEVTSDILTENSSTRFCFGFRNLYLYKNIMSKNGFQLANMYSNAEYFTISINLTGLNVPPNFLGFL